MADKGMRKRKGNKASSEDQKKLDKHGKLIHAPDSAGGKTFMQKLLRRFIVGMVLVGILWLVIINNHVYICGMVIVIQVVCYREIVTLRYNSLQARRKVKWFRSLNYYLLFASLFYFYLKPFLTQIGGIIPSNIYDMLEFYHMYLSFGFYVIGFCGFVLSLTKGHYKHQFTQLAWTIMCLLLIFGQTTVFIWNIFDGIIWFLLPVALIVFNDVAAYFSGVLLGRKIIKRQFLALSPNKTWEGFIGAAIFTMIFGWFFAGILAQYPYFTCPKVSFSVVDFNCQVNPVFLVQDIAVPQQISDIIQTLTGSSITTIHDAPIKFHGLILAAFASIIAPFGGFLASGMKRAFGVKDFDNIFPGHGGMTDRMDCQMIMGLATYVHVHTFITTVSSVPAILYAIETLSREDQFAVLEGVKEMLR